MDTSATLSTVGTDLTVVIITGLSGSGKTTALKVFEDMGFFTVDGLPVALAVQMVSVIAGSGMSHYSGIALGMDLRESEFIKEYEESVRALHSRGFSPRILFFEAREDVLIKRYATTRRPHPLEKEGLGLEQAIEMERSRTKRLRKMADMVLDTSTYSIHGLRRVIQEKWKHLRHLTKMLRVHIITFGFKYGTPSEADMVFDLRFLPNPYFVPELKPLSGCDAEVSAYVLANNPGKEFLVRLTNFLMYVLEQYEMEGRFRLTIAIGCTGGRHRSVATAEALAKALRTKYASLTLEHRHLELG
jgi:UPF0042 nucleotide-binding protein